MTEGKEQIREMPILEAATANDKETFLRIGQEVAGRTYVPVTDFEKEMSRGPVLMIRHNGETVGAVSYRKDEDGSIYLNTFTIDQKYQGQGIGKFALSQVLDLDDLKNAIKVWLVTHPDNTAAVALYESAGFKKGETKENYFDNGEPRLILTLEHAKEEI
ncbi:MAG: GNAT family N-acetyltransferase [Patescibacteria group bacterium]